MMIDKIRARVDYEVSMLNHRVIQQACRRASIHCPDCDYPQNAEKFEELIFEYVAIKRELHKRNKFYRGRLQSGCDLHPPEIRPGTHHGNIKRFWYPPATPEIRADLLKKYDTGCLVNAEYSAKQLRISLQKIWPCRKCIERYNPTRRMIHPPKSFPEEKGFLDV